MIAEVFNRYLYRSCTVTAADNQQVLVLELFDRECIAIRASYEQCIALLQTEDTVCQMTNLVACEFCITFTLAVSINTLLRKYVPSQNITVYGNSFLAIMSPEAVDHLKSEEDQSVIC